MKQRIQLLPVPTLSSNHKNGGYLLLFRWTVLIQWRKHEPCLQLSRLMLHRSPVVAFHVSFPSQPLLVVHNNLEEELKNPFLSLRMNPFAPKALLRTVAFADVFLLNNKLYKIPSNLSICQNPLFFVPHPQRHYHRSLPVITQLWGSLSPSACFFSLGIAWAQPPLLREMQAPLCLHPILPHPHLPKNPQETKSSPVPRIYPLWNTVGVPMFPVTGVEGDMQSVSQGHDSLKSESQTLHFCLSLFFN